MQFRVLVFALLTISACGSALGQTRTDEARALFPIEQNKKWGYIDRNGNIVIPAKFEAAKEFSEGLAVVQLNGRWGFVNATGELVVDARYSSANDFSEGLARVQVGGDRYALYGKWGFIDHEGHMVIEPQFVDVDNEGEEQRAFHEGLAMVEVDGRKGFIDKSGKIVIAPRFWWTYYFTDGLACASLGPDEKWGYIDKSGQWAIPPKFDDASLFQEGLAPVGLQDVCGYIDKTGAFTLRPRFKHSDNECAVVTGHFSGGLSRWQIGSKFGYLDKRGQIVVKPDFDLTFNFSEGLAFVEKDGKYGFIDQSGRMAIEPKFYDAKDFHNGLARVDYSRDGWGYVNKKGEFVWKTSTTTTDTESTKFIQAGHTRDLLFVGWSPDGKLLASYSAGDGWIKIWNPISGKLTWEIKATSLQADKPLQSPDGALLVSGVKDESYQVVDARTKNLIWNIKAHGTSDERVTSPDGRLIAERGSYGDACVKLLDANSNQLIRRLEGHPGIVYTIAFSPDGKLIASGNGDQTIKLWNAATGKLSSTLFGHSRKITSIAFSADSRTLVSGSEDDTLRIWDTSNGSLLRTITAFTPGIGGIRSVALSHDGKTVIAGSGTQVKIWDVTTGKLVRALATNESHTSGEPGGFQMTSCCGSEVRALALSDEGLVVSAHEDGTVKLWDANKGELLRTIKSRFPDLRSVALSPNGNLIATGYNEGDSRVDLWSVQTGKLVRSLGQDSDYVRSLCFSNDGSMIVTGHMSDDVKVWNTKTGKLIRQFKQPSSEDDQVAFSPDGEHIVSGGENQNIMLWDIRTGKLNWSAIPIDWEAEKLAEEEARKEAKIAAVAEAERKQRMREADKEATAWEKKIEITFEHFGEPLNPLEQHMMEKGEPNKSLLNQSAENANGVWLRLSNKSPLPIKFRTDSFYQPRPNCGVKLTNGAHGPGVCDGSEVSIQYLIEERDGKPVPYGVDFGSESVLPPGSSVLFSVARVHLDNGRIILVRFSYLKEDEKHELDDHGSSHRVSFRLQSR